MINKLLGFYELKRLGIPSVKWKKYTQETQFDADRLWTVRTAVQKGNDMNLPRAVGVTAKEAKEFAEKVRKDLNDGDMIIYYPYFIAEKSGALQISFDRYIIEVVESDLWNLTTKGRRDESIVYEKAWIKRYGMRLLTDGEMNEILTAARKVEGKFRSFLLEGGRVMLEWSYAVETGSRGQKKGSPYLVFYECRTL